jgi:hypothetical protein
MLDDTRRSGERLVVALIADVRMTALEIMSACQRLGLPPPATLPSGRSLDMLDSTAAAEPLQPEPPWMSQLLAALATPEVVVFAHRQETGSVAEISVIAALPPWAAEESPEAQDTYRLTLFECDELLERVVTFCRLADRAIGEAEQCEISGSGFVRILERAREDPSSALALLRTEGVPAADAALLVAALTSCERLAQVTVAHQPRAGRLEGMTTAWLDGGPAGLWRVDAPKLATSGDYGDYGDILLSRTSVSVAPVTRHTLIKEIASGFPQNVRKDLAESGGGMTP